MKKVLFISVLFLFAICFASGQAYAQGLWTGNVNVFYGVKTIDSDDWSITSYDFDVEDYVGDITLVSIDKAAEFGINVDFGPFTWPICFAFGYFKASGDDTWSFSESYDDPWGDLIGTDSASLKFEASTQEIRLGVKKVWEPVVPIRPYVAGGLAYVSADADLTGSWSTDWSEEYEGYGLEDWSESIKYSDSGSAIGLWLAGGIYWTIAQHFNVGVELGYSKAEVEFDDFDIKCEAGGIHYGLFAGYHW